MFLILLLGYYLFREDYAFCHLLCFRDSEPVPSPSSHYAYCNPQTEALAILYPANKEQYCSFVLICLQLSWTQMDAASAMDLKGTQAVAVLFVSYVFIYMLLIVTSRNTCMSCQELWYPVAILSFHQ